MGPENEPLALVRDRAHALAHVGAVALSIDPSPQEGSGDASSSTLPGAELTGSAGPHTIDTWGQTPPSVSLATPKSFILEEQERDAITAFGESQGEPDFDGTRVF